MTAGNTVREIDPPVLLGARKRFNIGVYGCDKFPARFHYPSVPGKTTAMVRPEFDEVHSIVATEIEWSGSGVCLITFGAPA